MSLLPRLCVFAHRHAAFHAHFAHARQQLAVAGAALLVGGCATAVPIERVSTTEPTAPPAPLTIGPAANDTFGGWIPDGQTLSPFDVSNPALAQLDPALLNAVQAAANAAREQGIDLRINSGWRSRGFQQQLFDDAARTYGSVDIAKQFVASPDVSKHVAGQAVDVERSSACARSMRTRSGTSNWPWTRRATARRCVPTQQAERLGLRWECLAGQHDYAEAEGDQRRAHPGQ
jgi:D-alanyl-D-alanine carboxypeptidase